MVFRSKTDSSGEVKKPAHHASRVPLVITIVVLAVVGSAYYAYYRKQAEYYTGRNLRLLAMLTERRHPSFPNVPSIAEPGRTLPLRSFSQIAA